MYPDLNIKQIAEKSHEVIKNLNPDGSYSNFTKHKNQALDFRTMLTDQFIFFNNKYHDKNTLFGSKEFVAYLMTLGSGMTSPGRKAAYPWGI